MKKFYSIFSFYFDSQLVFLKEHETLYHDIKNIHKSHNYNYYIIITLHFLRIHE